MLYTQLIAVCSEIHTKPVYTLCEQNVELLNVKAGGTYSDHWALRGEIGRGEVMPEEMEHYVNLIGLLTTERSLFGAVDGFPRCNCCHLSLGCSRKFLGEQC
jgi:hypothetical protein